jgi:predicted O-linked N-acetylglucosamine transferase (SPINDLY family)
MIASDFSARGVTPERIEIRQLMPFRSFLEVLKEVDIGLDSYPYAGGTTTLHSLWMGVPVVTLAGRTAFSRNSVGPLSETGLSRLVASNPEDYVHRAVELSQNLPRVANIRVGLRDRMRRSPLIDANCFTRNLEAAYRAVWRNYCSGRGEAIDIA